MEEPSEGKNPFWAQKRSKLATPLSDKRKFLAHLKSAEHINRYIYEQYTLYPLWFVPIDHSYLSSVSEFNAILNSENSVKTYLNYEIYNGIMALDESNIFRFKCFCFLGMIYFKSRFKFRKQNKRARSGCPISLHSKVLEQMFGTREFYRIKQCLEDFGVIEVGHDSGRIGLHTKTYRIAPRFFKQFAFVRLYLSLSITGKIFKKKPIFGKTIELSRKDEGRRNFFMSVMQSCSLADGHLDAINMVPDDAKTFTIRSIDKMYDRRFKASPDLKTGRWFNWATSCPKDLRPYILIDGEKTVEVDYGNMQPWLCVTIYEESDLVNPDVANEIEKYRKISRNNEFYDFFSVKAGIGLVKGERRKEFKQRVFKEIFFGPTNDNHLLWRFFSKEFPVLAERIKKIKNIDYTLSSRKLQQMEARIMIDGVLDELIENEVKCLTVHDSIICKKSDYGFVNRVMTEKFREVMKDNPILSLK